MFEKFVFMKGKVFVQINSKNLWFFEGKIVSEPRFSEYERTDKNTGETKLTSVTRFTLEATGGKSGDSQEALYIGLEVYDSAAHVLATTYSKNDRLAGYGILRNNKRKDKVTGEEWEDIIVRVSRFFPVAVRSLENNEENFGEEKNLLGVVV